MSRCYLKMFIVESSFLFYLSHITEFYCRICFFKFDYSWTLSEDRPLIACYFILERLQQPKNFPEDDFSILKGMIKVGHKHSAGFRKK